MSTANRRKTAAPDWHAINRGMDARQRAAFNAFHGRLRELVEEIQHDLRAANPEDPPPGSSLADAEERVEQLAELIRTIPWLWK
jgi:hypothetical protein